VTNLKKLEKLTRQLELHENDFINYVIEADYSIVLVSEAGRIKWCNEFFQQSFKVDNTEIHNKGLKSIIGVDISKWSRKTVTVDINGATHTVKIRDLNRNGKLIHKKVTLVPHE
jgi:c-di-AMP phosphodiesterase-like protein